MVLKTPLRRKPRLEQVNTQSPSDCTVQGVKKTLISVYIIKLSRCLTARTILVEASFN